MITHPHLGTCRPFVEFYWIHDARNLSRLGTAPEAVQLELERENIYGVSNILSSRGLALDSYLE